MDKHYKLKIVVIILALVWTLGLATYMAREFLTPLMELNTDIRKWNASPE